MWEASLLPSSMIRTPPTVKRSRSPPAPRASPKPSAMLSVNDNSILKLFPCATRLLRSEGGHEVVAADADDIDDGDNDDRVRRVATKRASLAYQAAEGCATCERMGVAVKCETERRVVC